jgi:hypothetical protein
MLGRLNEPREAAAERWQLNAAPTSALPLRLLTGKLRASDFGRTFRRRVVDHLDELFVGSQECEEELAERPDRRLKGVKLRPAFLTQSPPTRKNDPFSHLRKVDHVVRKKYEHRTLVNQPATIFQRLVGLPRRSRPFLSRNHG